MFFRISTLALAAIVLLPAVAGAQDTTKWIVNPMMLDFSDPNNWSEGVPTSDDVAIFDIGGLFKVTMDVDGSVKNLDYNSGEMTLLGPKKLTVANGLELNNDINVSAGCVLACNADLTIQDNQNAEMALSNNDTVLNVAGDIFLGNSNGTRGELIVIGGSSVVADQIFVGAIDRGALYIRSGGNITTNELIVGDNIDSNADTFVEFGGQANAVATLVGSSGTGDLVVTDSSVFTSSSIICGNKPDGVGNITVITDGLINAGDIIFGREGSGGITVGDGIVDADNVDLGLLPGSSGNLVVFENGIFDCEQLNIGGSGTADLLIWEAGSVLVNQTTTLGTGSSIQFQDSPNFGLLQSEEGIVAEGIIEFLSGTGRIVGDLILQGAGEIKATGGRGTIIGNVVHNGSRIFVFDQTEFVIDGNYQGDGPMEGGGNVTFLGALSPGDGTAFIDLDVDVDLPSSSELKIEIGGTQSGQYDRLIVGDNLNINECELSIEMVDEFEPQPGDSFLIADVGGNLNGTFAGLANNSFFTSDDGVPLQILYNTTADEIRVVVQDAVIILGDCNFDGVVNLLDVGPFINILTGVGYLSEADVNQDGSVDLLDVGPFIELIANG